MVNRKSITFKKKIKGIDYCDYHCQFPKGISCIKCKKKLIKTLKRMNNSNNKSSSKKKSTKKKSTKKKSTKKKSTKRKLTKSTKRKSKNH